MAQTVEQLLALKRESSVSFTSSSSDSSFSSSPPTSILSSVLENGGDESEDACLQGLKEFCKEFELALDKELIFRFAFYNSFDFTKSKKAIEDNCDNPHLFLRMESKLATQLEKQMFFPVPGLRTRDGRSEVIYYKPSLLVPSDSPFSIPMMIQNVCYVYNDMNRTEEQCRNGVVILVDMAGYSMKNYSGEASKSVMAAIQGQVVPCEVSQFLLINPPKLLVKLWKLSKAILSSSFRKRTRIIKGKVQLSDFLMEGCEEYLPEEIELKGRKASEMVEDYIDLKKYDENPAEQSQVLVESLENDF